MGTWGCWSPNELTVGQALCSKAFIVHRKGSWGPWVVSRIHPQLAGVLLTGHTALPQWWAGQLNPALAPQPWFGVLWSTETARAPYRGKAGQEVKHGFGGS